MTLNELTLVNFKAHRNSTFKFFLGINGIVGENGAGKSCIIEAIEFLFTGDLSKTKEETITRGLADGYVRGKFVLNGKEGSIERHLSSSKVVLEYAGKKYMKAGEVKELWASMLQIDKHIFHNVIVARQNKIPELFTGDTTSREKVFQKIFMVPNTDKIRNLVYDYIKNAPPMSLEEDIGELQLRINALTLKSAPIKVQLTNVTASILDEPVVLNFISRTNYLNKCIKDRNLKPELEQKLTVLDFELTNTESETTKLEEELKVIDYPKYKGLYEELMAAHSLWNVKIALHTNFTSLNELAPVSEEQHKIRTSKLKDIKDKITKLTEDFGVCKNDSKILTDSINSMLKLKECASCPTCKQALPDVPGMIVIKQDELQRNRAKTQGIINEIEAFKLEFDALQKQVTAEDTRRKKLSDVLMEFSKHLSVRFNKENFQIAKTIVEDFTNKQDRRAELRLVAANKRTGVMESRTKLNSLQVYNGEYPTPDEELVILNEVLRENNIRKNESSQLQLELVKIDTESNGLKDRIVISKANRVKNTKLATYTKDLSTLYEILHITQLPRQLVQTYSSVVEEELAINLQKFNLPYKPKIVDGFKIQMIDENGYDIPEVSGAQQVIVGLSLHMALHNLFSQSFPILIIDEGTTSMDERNREKYFEAISSLRKTSDIKQFIIIDHDPALADVVDHVIKL